MLMKTSVYVPHNNLQDNINPVSIGQNKSKYLLNTNEWWRLQQSWKQYLEMHKIGYISEQELMDDNVIIQLFTNVTCV